MTTSELFLVAMVLIFTVPYLIWRVFNVDFYAPLVVVQIICGIVLGPGVLGAIVPDYYKTVFTPEVIQALNGIAWWAVMIFVWIAGIELDLSTAWANRRETAITAGLALGTPLIFGCGVAIFMLTGGGWIGAKALPLQFVFGIGMACAVTALPILILLMEKLEILRQPIGQRILRYASLDDVAIWGVLALILLDWTRIARQIGFLVVFAVATLAYRSIMVRLQERDRWYVGLVWLTACGLSADWSGLHFMVGAFLAGAVTDSVWFDRDRTDQLRHHVLLVIMPVFFLSTGLRTNWDVGGLTVFAMAAVLLVASVAGKLAGIHIAARVLGWGPGEASVIGWLLQKIGRAHV